MKKALYPDRRVVVTGMGAVTPLGNTAGETWEGLKKGVSGVGLISIFDAKTFPTRIAAEVKGFDFARWIETDPELTHTNRSTFFALQAAEEALKDSKIEARSIPSEKFGIYFGAGESGVDFPALTETLIEAIDEKSEHLIHDGLYLDASKKHMHALKEIESQPFMTLNHLARRFNIRGPVSNCLTACAASSQAIGEAFEWIRRGDADVVMSGGAHSMIYPLGVSGFSLLRALSVRNDTPQKASRPFDKNRDGFVMGEGAGVLILEELSHALKRGTRIYGEIVGYGATADAYRLTDMDPEGRGAQRAIQIAMAKAGLKPTEIDYISAHGTSTAVNDSVETVAIKNTMGDHAYKIPMSSIKSMLGHTIAAAGAIEAIVCFLTFRDKIVPPTINYEVSDPACDLDYVPNESRKANVQVALSNSFGFGGQNICLAMREYRENS